MALISRLPFWHLWDIVFHYIPSFCFILLCQFKTLKYVEFEKMLLSMSGEEVRRAVAYARLLSPLTEGKILVLPPVGG